MNKISKLLSLIISAGIVSSAFPSYGSGATRDSISFYNSKKTILDMREYDEAYDTNHDGVVNVFDVIRENKEVFREESYTDLKAQIHSLETQIEILTQKLTEKEDRTQAESDLSIINSVLSGKIDQQEGKQLSSNDYTDEDKNKLGSLENYDDTKLNEKIDSLVQEAYKEKEEIESSIQNKVGKEEGKQLSSNDYTDEEKLKLESLNNYDDSEIKKNINDIENDLTNLENELTNIKEISHVIIVDQKGTGDFVSIKDAIGSINDCSENNPYVIKVLNGTYDEYDINLPDGICIIGEDRYATIIKGYLSPSATDSNHRSSSTFNGNSSFKLENLTVTAQNMRYVLHSESGGENKNWNVYVRNCRFEHFGNQEIIDYRIEQEQDYSKVWEFCYAWGEGGSSGSYAQFNDCEFISANSNGYYIHQSVNQDKDNKPYLHIFNNCVFENKSGGTALFVTCTVNESAFNGVIDTVKVNNSVIKGKVSAYSFQSSPVNLIFSGCGQPIVTVLADNRFYEGAYPTFSDYDKYLINNTGSIIGYGSIMTYGNDEGSCALANEGDEILGISITPMNGISNGQYVHISGNKIIPMSTTKGKKFKVNNGTLIETTDNDYIAIAISDNYIKLL